MKNKNLLLTKSGKPISQKTFGTLVGKDKACRHAGVDLNFYDYDLRLFGRYLHYCGYQTIEEARDLLIKLAIEGRNPYAEVKKKVGKILDFKEWKSRNKDIRQT